MRVVTLSVTVGVGVATAQTVIVRHASRGATIEILLNGEAGRSATADANGDATLAVALPAGTDESSVRFAIDVCATRVRVELVSSGVQPMPSPGCIRNENFGVFVIRRVTTFVVDLEGSVPTIHLTQGPAPPSWLGLAQLPQNGRRTFLRGTPQTGLVLFGGAGAGLFSNAVNVTCGNAPACTGSNLKGAAAVGAAYWISRFFGAEITYAKPARASANGSGDTFNFSSTLDSRVVTAAGTVGVPVGPVRLYGLAGGNYHRATFSTTETIADATVVINNATQIIKGGTQTFEHTTQGWNWLFGGGLEAWATKSIGFYAEAQHARLKATDLGSAEGGIDQHLTLIVLGMRVRLGG
jgi:hypothetical protein